jgi:hypothetical protein
MWVIVTCENRAGCQQTLDSAGDLPGINLVVVNGGSDDYDNLKLPKGWEIIRTSETRGFNEVLNSVFNYWPDEEYYGVIPDNCIIQSTSWDEKMKESSKGRYVASCDDGNEQPFPFTGIRIWPGSLLRKIGFWGLPKLHTSGFDEAWIKIAWDVVLFERCLDVKIGYLPRPKGLMDREAESHLLADKEVFDSWRINEYYKAFRKLQFGGDKWHGKTNFIDGDEDAKNQQTDTIAQEDGNGRQAL